MESTGTQPEQTTQLTELAPNAALLVIDVQKGFGNPSLLALGRSNPAAEENIRALLDAWQDAGRPVVFVRHSSLEPGSPLHPDTPGNELQDFVEKRRTAEGRRGPEVLIEKTVNSAFIGTPDLADWLEAQGIRQLVTAGIQTNRCVETTARMGGNLGYDVVVPIDATYTFGDTGPGGEHLTADELSLATAVNLHGGGFARVVSTAEVLAALGG
ncbi:cysteine hydrolase [Streptomyces armeniacus]|uniref:Cysteine hydrolase n=1 Tax=Streptomyces armeniacus TaxID=83291 RepID=A0A345XYE1_9ACTN|nr:cysteine hydrolase family protein [Streptomyces armeniacus]AXK36657.1 cysteine hydrolase [Streptomyces armeniacus]